MVIREKRKGKYWLIIVSSMLFLVLWQLIVQYWAQPVRVPEFKLANKVTMTQALSTCDRGVLLVVNSSKLMLYGWHGQRLWSVPVPHPNHTGRPTADPQVPSWRIGWITDISNDGHYLAIASVEKQQTRLSVFADGHQLFTRLFPINDDYLSLQVGNDGRVLFWGRSKHNSPLWVIEKTKLAAQGSLPWLGCDITPGAIAVVAPNQLSKYIYYHGYHCREQIYYGTLSIHNSRVTVITPRILHGIFSLHCEPESISGHVSPDYPRAVVKDFLFSDGVVLSLDGKRFSPDDQLDSWPALGGNWERSDGWISYTPDIADFPSKAMSAISNEYWRVPNHDMYPRFITNDGQFMLVQNMPHLPTPADFLWELGHNEVTSPTSRAQTRRYLGVIERPGVWRAVLPIASDIQDHWPQWGSTYSIWWPILSPDGHHLIFLGEDRHGGKKCFFFTI